MLPSHINKHKIVIFDKNATPINGGFRGHGFGLLRNVKRCEIFEELNGEYSLELDYPIDGIRSEHLTKWNIILANGQLFRIYKTEKDSSSFTVTAFARHIFYDINNGFVLDDRVVNGTMEEALEASIPDAFKTYFTVSSDIPITNSIYHVRKNGVKCVFDTLKRWGVGELSRDNFHFSIDYSKGKKTNAIFTAKKIEGITITADADEVATRLLPVGKDGLTLPERYIDIPNWTTEEYPPFHIVKEVNFEDVEDEGTLRELALQMSYEIGFEAVNIKIDVHQIQGTTAYANQYEFDSIEVGDVVFVKHEKVDYRIRTKVISRTIDLINKTCTIELGQPIAGLNDFYYTSFQKQLITAQSNLKTDMQYWQNGVEMTLHNQQEHLASVNISTKYEEGSISGLAFLTMICQAEVEDDLYIRVMRNNNELLLKPNITVHEGINHMTFHWPLTNISLNENVVFDLYAWTNTNQNVTIKPSDATLTVFGTGLVVSGSQSNPNLFIEETLNTRCSRNLPIFVEDAVSVGIELIDNIFVEANETLESTEYPTLDWTISIEHD